MADIKDNALGILRFQTLRWEGRRSNDEQRMKHTCVSRCPGADAMLLVYQNELIKASQ